MSSLVTVSDIRDIWLTNLRLCLNFKRSSRYYCRLDHQYHSLCTGRGFPDLENLCLNIDNLFVGTQSGLSSFLPALCCSSERWKSQSPDFSKFLVGTTSSNVWGLYCVTYCVIMFSSLADQPPPTRLLQAKYLAPRTPQSSALWLYRF